MIMFGGIRWRNNSWIIKIERHIYNAMNATLSGKSVQNLRLCVCLMCIILLYVMHGINRIYMF